MKTCAVMVMMMIGAAVNKGFAQETSKMDSLATTYYESIAFQKQLVKTQLITGGILTGGGLGMIAGGIVKKHNANKNASTVNAEGVKVTTVRHNNGASAGLIVSGGIASIIGAVLMKKGVSTFKEIRNPNGKVMAEVGLPTNGEVGLSMKF